MSEVLRPPKRAERLTGTLQDALVVEKPLSIIYRLYNEAWLRKSFVLLGLALI